MAEKGPGGTVQPDFPPNPKELVQDWVQIVSKLCIFRSKQVRAPDLPRNIFTIHATGNDRSTILAGGAPVSFKMFISDQVCVLFLEWNIYWAFTVNHPANTHG